MFSVNLLVFLFGSLYAQISVRYYFNSILYFDYPVSTLFFETNHISENIEKFGLQAGILFELSTTNVSMKILHNLT